MQIEAIEARMRAYESATDPAALPGVYLMVRLDGRSFTRLTKEELPLEKPFDQGFHLAMLEVVDHLMSCGFGVTLEYTQSDEISLLHTVGTGAKPLVVDCQILLTRPGHAAACMSAREGIRITWIDSGEVVDAGPFGFSGAPEAAREQSFVLAGMSDDGQSVRVVSVGDDGTPDALTVLSAADGVAHVLPVGTAQAVDGSTYVTILEDRPDQSCTAGTPCPKTHLVRLVPP